MSQKYDSYVKSHRGNVKRSYKTKGEKIMNNKTTTITAKKIVDCEDKNGRYYLELPDGYRLIYDNDGYIGRYNPKLNEVI